MNFNINPEKYNDVYLENLNICFPNWGDISTFNWVFLRTVNGRKADFFTINSEENDILGGSAITYRKIVDFNNYEFEIGIMTGSFTLPTARGMGCFSKAISKSLEIVFENDVPLLTAFVTEDNASYRRLANAGSFLIKTNYIISQKVLNSERSYFFKDLEILQKTKDTIVSFYETRKQMLKSKVHFTYSLEEFQDQFINRVNPTFLLKIGDEKAIIEESESIFKLNFCTDYNLETISQIVDWANSRKKQIIFFSTDNNHAFNNNFNFKIIRGFFTLLKNEVNQDIKFKNLIDFHIEYGDKM